MARRWRAALLALFVSASAAAQPTYPDLRESHDPGLQASFDEAFRDVYIDEHPAAGRGMVDGIRVVDDLMLEQARVRRQQTQ